MHLLSFITIRQAGLFMRLTILLAQGVMWNAFFLSYLISPKACHRFVGYLEEEAGLSSVDISPTQSDTLRNSIYLVCVAVLLTHRLVLLC